MRRKPKAKIKKPVRKLNRLSAVQQEHRLKIVNAILNAGDLYIKGTGVKVAVKTFEEDFKTKYLEDRFYLTVEATGKLDVRALDKFSSYSLRNPNNRLSSSSAPPGDPEPYTLSGTIDLNNVDTIPFSGNPGANALYGSSN